ncbi:LysR family substrate-binding domain-containing protein [Bradyrhizobium sp. WSM1253]|uniref:LysR family substrate-binding domain-containing protein n=1 Tax=Bradyrhizobium sp. WSM1253 TaxID=319003 RepID=UPI0009FEFBF5
MASLASGFLADLLGAYHRRFPGIEIKLDEATSQVNASAVLNGRLDAAFIPGDPKLPGCRAERLWDEKICVAVPDAHAMAALGAVTWDDVRHETFLVTADAAGPEIEDHLVRQLSGPGFHPRISVLHTILAASDEVTQMLLIKCIVHRPDMAVLASFRCSAIVSRPLYREPPRYGYSDLRRGLFIGLGKPPRLASSAHSGCSSKCFLKR